MWMIFVLKWPHAHCVSVYRSSWPCAALYKCVYHRRRFFREKFCSVGVALMCISAIFSPWPFVKYSSVLFVRSQETSVHCILLRNSVYVALAYLYCSPRSARISFSDSVCSAFMEFLSIVVSFSLFKLQCTDACIKPLFLVFVCWVCGLKPHFVKYPCWYEWPCNGPSTITVHCDWPFWRTSQRQYKHRQSNY